MTPQQRQRIVAIVQRLTRKALAETTEEADDDDELNMELAEAMWDEAIRVVPTLEPEEFFAIMDTIYRH